MGEYIVFGLGAFGRSLADELQGLGHDVMGVDTNRELVQEMADTLREVVEADATSESALRELGIANFDAAVVAIGDIENSVLCTLLVKKLGGRLVIAKAISDLHREILQLVGAERVIFPEKEMANSLAHSIVVPEATDYLSLSASMGVVKLMLPTTMIGKSFDEVVKRSRSDLRLLAVIRRDRVIFGASVGEPLASGDALLVAGQDNELRDLGSLRSDQ